ncbi:hypothetical protein MACH09_38400 [Vibrio sp. MACH09]|nr:hypothetical protein MACH09_38400 [Vibrio sp. MACH09]
MYRFVKQRKLGWPQIWPYDAFAKRQILERENQDNPLNNKLVKNEQQTDIDSDELLNTATLFMSKEKVIA